MARFGVGLSFDASFHVDVQDPSPDRFRINALRVEVVEPSGTLQPVCRSIQIVNEADGGNHFLPPALHLVERHLLNARLEIAFGLVDVGFQATDPHLLVSDLPEEDQDDDGKERVGGAQA